MNVPIFAISDYINSEKGVREMAAYNFDGASLKLSFETGLDEFGKPVLTSRTYRNVRNDVPVESIAAVTTAIANLSKYPLHQAQKSETESIVF